MIHRCSRTDKRLEVFRHDLQAYLCIVDEEHLQETGKIQHHLIPLWFCPYCGESLRE